MELYSPIALTGVECMLMISHTKGGQISKETTEKHFSVEQKCRPPEKSKFVSIILAFNEHLFEYPTYSISKVT